MVFWSEKKNTWKNHPTTHRSTKESDAHFAICSAIGAMNASKEDKGKF